ncbi:MAG: imidazolonepropionase-like amidohydrolase [Verrucomicrobiales bacterium]|jgi:imidazolonepropionase-like amidohydrolase
MNRYFAALTPLLCLFAPWQLLGNDTVPPGAQSKPILIIGATIHPVSSDPIPRGQLLLVGGKVEGVFAEESDFVIPDGTVTIELAEEKHIYPGMIAANSVLGLVEINAVRATVDIAEPGAINPNARAQISVNPDSELIPVTRANGVLATLTIPRGASGGLIGGQSALMRMDGWTWEEMTIKSPVGMHVFWPELRQFPRWTSTVDEKELEKMRKAYGEAVEKLTEAFADTRAYVKAAEGETVDTDLRWEALAPVLAGELRLFIHAQTAGQIQDALHFTAREKIASPVIVGGRDAWRLTSELAARDAAVILSPVNDLPRRWEAYDTPYTAASKLHAAGIPFCIANSGSAFDAANERNLPYQAARAAAHGLDPETAFKSVTLFPAQILGVADRLGSLEDGREATFFVTNGDPLEVRTTVERAWIRGREIDLSSRHTQLFEKYQEKYRQRQQAE